MHLWSIGAMAEYLIYVSFGGLVQPVFTLGFGLYPRLVGWAMACREASRKSAQRHDPTIIRPQVRPSCFKTDGFCNASHAGYAVFQIAEAVIPRRLCAMILRR
jgi:hypothetical protein